MSIIGPKRPLFAMPGNPDKSDKESNACDTGPKGGSLPGFRKQWGSPDVAAAFDCSTPLLIETLVHHWSTGQGTRVRHILWSLYTCSHLVNLGEACSGLDRRLAEALAAAVTARLILGPEVEPMLRQILQTSGEFARFNREESITPEHLPVIYPPAAADARTFREMAASLDNRNARAD